MVHELGMRCPNNPVTGLTHSEAKINIVKGNGEMRFIETAELLIKFSPNDSASRGHCGEILRQMRARKVAALVADADVRVARYSARPENHAAMLHGTVRGPEPRPDHSDFRSHRMAYHFAQPRCIHHFHIVIQQRNQRSASQLHSAIVQAAVIEWALHPRNLDAAAPLQ